MNIIPENHLAVINNFIRIFTKHFMAFLILTTHGNRQKDELGRLISRVYTTDNRLLKIESSYIMLKVIFNLHGVK